MGKHARYSPSAAHRWLHCPASVALTEGRPDNGNEYADEGTAAHFLAAVCLNTGEHPTQFIGVKIEVVDGDAQWGGLSIPESVTLRTFAVDGEMAGNVNQYVQAVRQQAEGGSLQVEVEVPVGEITGEADAAGSADAVVLTAAGELQVHDLKYGRGVVEAEENEQLGLYLAAVLPDYEMIGDIKSMRLFIHQPRAGGVREWEVPAEWLEALKERAREAAKLGEFLLADTTGLLKDPKSKFYAPGEKQCQWCTGKAACPAAEREVARAVAGVESFEDLDTKQEARATVLELDDVTLGNKMAMCDYVEGWIKAVRAEVESRVFAGGHVPGWKLVGGKKGARQWDDPTEAENVLKSMRLKVEEMYDMKLISPTTAEKIFGEKGTAPSVKRWNKLQRLIVQKDGQPTVAPESDKRPALVLDVTEKFDDVDDGGDMV